MFFSIVKQPDGIYVPISNCKLNSGLNLALIFQNVQNLTMQTDDLNQDKETQICVG